MGKSVMKNKSAIRLATGIGAATLLAFASAATKADDDRAAQRDG
jgi:hypothetical protein